MSAPNTLQSVEGARIRLTGLIKKFRRPGGDVVSAVDDISLSIDPGEFLVLVGPSGCGKTTLLRCLAGLEEPDSGEIELSGSTVFSSAAKTNLPPERRRAAMLFQSYALWPHMRVRDNVAFPLQSTRGAERTRRTRPDVRAAVASALRRVHCEHIADSYPGEISGGQQQRVALARALVREDPVIFFDEPLSNIDAQLREELRYELRTLQEEIGFSAIYVTHDQTEAMALADRIAVVRDGRIAQLGTPGEVYDRPASGYVARFMGAVNEFPGIVRKVRADETIVRTNAGEVTVAHSGGWSGGDRVIVMGRPSRAHLRAAATSAGLSIEVEVQRSIYLGTYADTVVGFGDVLLRSWLRPEAGVRVGERARLEYSADDLMIVADDGLANVDLVEAV